MRHSANVIVISTFAIALIKATASYTEKQQAGKSNEKHLINLAWKMNELSMLNENGRKLLVDTKCLVDKFQNPCCDWVEGNIPRQLSSLQQRVTTFIRGVTRHKRTAATHILVFMISPEERCLKPYALPVQCIPYKGLSDAKTRDLANKVIHEMTKRKMKVAGNHSFTAQIYFC